MTWMKDLFSDSFQMKLRVNDTLTHAWLQTAENTNSSVLYYRLHLMQHLSHCTWSSKRRLLAYITSINAFKKGLWKLTTKMCTSASPSIIITWSSKWSTNRKLSLDHLSVSGKLFVLLYLPLCYHCRYTRNLFLAFHLQMSVARN